jgi:aerobic carbon-monoxide dehydrogenase medium subunit
VIPAPFAYERAGSLEVALAALAGSDGSTRALAGGQSLIPLMKLRLARPERLVDIGRLDELRGSRRLDDGRLAIGALTTWATLLDAPAVLAYELLADALPDIGDVQVRNRGTIGGSLAHADPASDIAAPALALGVELVARSRDRGERIVAIEDFFAGPFMSALAPDELLVELRLPASSGRVGSAYRSLAQPASGYPLAGVAAVVGRTSGDDGPIGLCRVGVTGVGEMPYRATAVEDAILDGASPAEAARLVNAGQRIGSDIHADREYRTALTEVMARRALEAALARLTQAG